MMNRTHANEKHNSVLSGVCDRLSRQIETLQIELAHLKSGAIWAENMVLHRQLTDALSQRDEAIRQREHERDDRLRAYARNATLTRALNLVTVRCDNLHHPKSLQHDYGIPCPVEKIVYRARTGGGEG